MNALVIAAIFTTQSIEQTNAGHATRAVKHVPQIQPIASHAEMSLASSTIQITPHVWPSAPTNTIRMLPTTTASIAKLHALFVSVQASTSVRPAKMFPHKNIIKGTMKLYAALHVMMELSWIILLLLVKYAIHSVKLAKVIQVIVLHVEK